MQAGCTANASVALDIMQFKEGGDASLSKDRSFNNQAVACYMCWVQISLDPNLEKSLRVNVLNLITFMVGINPNRWGRGVEFVLEMATGRVSTKIPLASAV